MDRIITPTIRQSAGMKEKPILFSTPMVQAILEGRKTMTRRVVKKKYANTDLVMRTDKYGTRLIERQNDAPADEEIVMPDGSKATRCNLIAIRDVEPRYKPGDILWVRETFTYRECASGHCVHYKADGDVPDGVAWGKRYDTKDWIPSIYMPREAARIFRRVTNVRAERLQEITTEQAIKEGVQEFSFGMGETAWAVSQDQKTKQSGPIGAFACLWDSINAAPKAVYERIGNERIITHYVSYPWESIQETRTYRGLPWFVWGNPWVWAYEFERCEQAKRE